jgi:signal transduction histidine kinase
VSFKFAARTLLELGKELISSDEVAINELVKNAIDAGSPSVQCAFNIVITHRIYQDALDGLADGKDVGVVLTRIQRAVLPNAPEADKAAFLEGLGEAGGRSAKRFEATLRDLYQRFNWIEVRDQGHGMSERDLNDIYLTVGTRSRRKDNLAGATYLGDKGVGRLSAMRLGERLDVQTTKNGERHFNNLTIDWSRFGHDSESDVDDIEVAPTIGDAKPERTIHGTIIRVSELNGDWTKERLNELLMGPIARMVDPFEIGRAYRLLKFEHNGERLIVPSIPEKLLQAAHATCVATLKFERNGTPVFEGDINYKLRNARIEVRQRGVEVYSMTQVETSVRGKKGHAAVQLVPIRPKVLQDLGPFRVEIYWFNRLIVKAIEGVSEKNTGTRAEIARWAGGPMLYRREFRVLPYGDPDDDWLELDKKAFGQAGFKLNRQQVIGRVQITSPHTAMSEQTNREGLVDSAPAAALKSILMWLLHTEMRNLINEADEAEILKDREAEKVTEAYWQTEARVKEVLRDLRDNVPAASRAVVDRLNVSVGRLAEQCAAVVKKTDDSVREAATEREKFVHLAGIGLMTEFIFHELERAVSHAYTELQDARKEHPRSPILKSLEDQLATLLKRVSAFDSLTGERRQTKVRFDVQEVVNTVLLGHVNQFKRHAITAEVVQDKPLELRAVRGMLVQILENLVANSVYWLKHQVEYEPGFQPKIVVEISGLQKTLRVTDNGPGVDPARAERIFQPFVTSKPAGAGRGLGLYISRELAGYHDWKIRIDKDAEPTRNGRLNSFIVEFGEGK